MEVHKLTKSEEFYHSLVETSQDLIWQCDAEGKYTFLNLAWEQVFGYELDEMLGKKISDFQTTENAVRNLFIFEQLMRGESLDHYEAIHLGKYGNEIHLIFNALFLTDEKGEFAGARGTAYDITQRKLMEATLQDAADLLETQAGELRQFNESLEELVYKRTAELQEERQRLVGIIRGTNVGTWEWNIQTGKTTFNNRWAEIIGYTLDEISPVSFESWRAQVHPEDLLLSNTLLERHFRGELEYYELESRIRHKSGDWVWILDRGKVASWTEDGKPLMMMGTHQDINERKRTEAVMAARLRLMQLPDILSLEELLCATLDEAELLTGSQMGFYHFVDPDQTTISLQAWSTNTSQRMCKVDGTGRHYLVDQAGVWVDCIRERRAVVHNDYAALTHRKGLPQGHVPVVRELVVPVMRNNNIVAVLGVGNKPNDYTANDIELVSSLADFAWDIVENKLKAAELLVSKQWLNQLAEQSNSITWEVDSKGLYTYMSSVCESVIGYSPNEVIGKMHFYDLHPESEREAFKEAVFAAFEQKEQLLNYENMVQSKTGQILWVSTNAIPVLSRDGSLLGYRGSDINITASKKLTEQLQRSQRMEAVGQLAGGLAHDFNNVLSIINGYCCLVKMDAEQEQDEQLKEYIDKILAASGRAGELTHSMLAFSRTQVINPLNQNLNGIVSRVEAFTNRIVGENIHLKSIVNEVSLPVCVDSGQIEQILINLITNARDAMPDGGELYVITDFVNMDDRFIAANGFGKPGPYALIAVLDTGEGMDEATKLKIFEPFFTTKEIGKGTGLGLAMVYGITKQHNGFVDVFSEPGKGSSLMVYLPIVGQKTAGDSPKTVSDTDFFSGDETIMVVEDSTDLREFMNKILLKLGYRVILAIDGQDAVDKFRDNADSIKLIIMDMIMPHKNGKTAYDEIKLIRPDTLALFCSGYSANIIQQLGELGENAAFIAKPVQPAVLLKKIREMLDR